MVITTAFGFPFAIIEAWKSGGGIDMQDKLGTITRWINQSAERSVDVDLSLIQAIADLREAVFRLETTIAAHAIDSNAADLIGATDARQLFSEHLGMSREAAQKLCLRAQNPWPMGISAEKQDIILAGLGRLSDRVADRHDIEAEIYTSAKSCSADQVRRLVSRKVRSANATVTTDPAEADASRYCTLSRQDTNGMSTLKAKLPAGEAALLKSLLDKAFKQGAGQGSGIEAKDDARAIEQRSADALGHVIKQASSEHIAKTGHASLIVSMLDTDFDNLDASARVVTNTGIDLNLLDLARLGEGPEDFIVVHDANGEFVKLATAQRCANFYQRIALMALDLVCQHPGCDRPHSECDAHHIVAYLMGGETCPENLTTGLVQNVDMSLAS